MRLHRPGRALGKGLLLSAPLGLGLIAFAAAADSLTLSGPGGEDIRASLNTTITLGVGIRMQSPSNRLVGKNNLNPAVCTGPGGAYQNCQGLFKDQIYPAQVLAAAAGAPSSNGDLGDNNYGKHSLFQAPLKATTDLTLARGKFGLFARALYFYDFVNNDFIETFPNAITPGNALQVGRHVPPFGGVLSPSVLAGCLSNPNPLLCPVQEIVLNQRGYGQPDGHGNSVVYGPGGFVRAHRTDRETLRQVGSNAQFLDGYVYGEVPLAPGHDLSFKLGRQVVNWGESTTLVLNSLNQANPINANNYYRVGNQTEEDFIPVNMLDVGAPLFDNVSLDAFYQLEWRPMEVPTPGSYFSSLPLGSNNLGSSINASLAQTAWDPDCLGRPVDSPLAAATGSCATIRRLPDRRPRSSGQFGFKLDYYAEQLGTGTDLSFYYTHYHSRLPYASFMSINASCARSAGNPQHVDATDLISLFATCPDLPIAHSLLNPGRPEAQFARSSVLEFDSARILLEYPADIDLLGFSFNGTLGGYSIQGEVAYRPNLPLQVDIDDLAFAAFGPSLTNCMNPRSGPLGAGCAGSTVGLGFTQNGGTRLYGSSDFTPAGGQAGFHDTFGALVGDLPGSARAFPNFIIPYRDGVIGENPPNSYIRGYERFQAYEFNLGITRVLGASENPFAADQILVVGELGAELIPRLPHLDRLVLQGPAFGYGATAGADGSGADGSRRSCAGAADCSLGPDGLRFNPHQQDPSGYPTPLSYGYRLISQLRYESLLPQVNFRPFLIWRQDLAGISPGPAGNFIKGAKQVDLLFETQYRQSWSLTVGYTWFWGGGDFNPLSDRDFAQVFVKYQF